MPQNPRPLTADERSLLDGLVQTSGPRLYAYVRRTFGHCCDPDDVVAETFCRAAANVAGLRATNRPDLYLLTIARNLCRDAIRRRRPESVPDERLDRETSRARDTAESAGDLERAERVVQAVGELPDGLREVFVLRISGGLKFEEIAALLEIPLGTALSRMHSAAERVREKMGCTHESV